MFPMSKALQADLEGMSDCEKTVRHVVSGLKNKNRAPSWHSDIHYSISHKLSFDMK